MLFQVPYGRTAFAGKAVAPAVKKHKVFISFCHNDQRYKDALAAWGERHGLFVDRSVDTGDISEDLNADQIRAKIRDEYLRDSTVTIVLVGTETRHRKHVDWEIHSSMHDGKVNKKSGILVVNLPTIAEGVEERIWAAHDGETSFVYPDISGWIAITSRQKFARWYPHMPARLLNNLNKARISVAPWNRIWEPGRLKFLLDAAFKDRKSCEYDFGKPMMRRNS